MAIRRVGPMTKKEGRDRIPEAREFLIFVALSFVDGESKKDALREAVQYYRDCVKAAERGMNIQ